MFIKCSNCGTRYSISDDSIGISGRKVKCSKCGNSWHQEPLKDIEIPKPEGLEELIKNIDKKSLPKVVETKIIKTPIWLMVATPITLAMLVFALFISFYTMLPFQKIYDKMGLFDSAGIKFTNVKVDYDKENGNLSMQGEITNISDKDVISPYLKVTFYDNFDRDQASIVHKITEIEKIGPGEKYYFDNNIEKLPFELKTIKIATGNRIEIFQR